MAVGTIAHGFKGARSLARDLGLADIAASLKASDASSGTLGKVAGEVESLLLGRT